MSSIKELLEKKAKRPEATAFVCVAADLVDRHQILSAELAEAVQKERNGGTSPRRLNAKSEAALKAAEVKAVEGEMADATVEVRLRAQIPAEWRAWKLENPAREGVTLDEHFGIDYEALITDMTRRCIVDPEFDDEDWATWLAEVANAEQFALAVKVFSMHEQRVDIPKSPLASLVTTANEGDSKPRPDSE